MFCSHPRSTGSSASDARNNDDWRKRTPISMRPRCRRRGGDPASEVTGTIPGGRKIRGIRKNRENRLWAWGEAPCPCLSTPAAAHLLGATAAAQPIRDTGPERNGSVGAGRLECAYDPLAQSLQPGAEPRGSKRGRAEELAEVHRRDPCNGLYLYMRLPPAHSWGSLR